MTVSLGDLSRNFVLRRHATDLKDNVARLTSELTTGQSQDLPARVRGNFATIASIERSLKVLDTYDTVIAETAAMASAMQTSLDKIETLATEAGPNLLATANSKDPALIAAAGEDAAGRFSAVMEALNTRVSDRSIFAGAATGGSAVATGPDILAALETAVAAETTAAGVAAVVDAWFDPGGGYDTLGYLGSTTSASARRLNDIASVNLDVTAADPAIRDVLKGLASAALVASDVPPGDPEEQEALIRSAGTSLTGASAAFISLRAEVGSVEARIEDARTENAAETTSLRITRSALAEVDPYRAAIELDAVQVQLETLYTLTARLSGLSLVNYLR